MKLEEQQRIYEQQLSDIREELERANDNASESFNYYSSSSPSLFKPNELCSKLPFPTFTSSRIWEKYLPTIIEASHNPLIPELQTDGEEEKSQFHLIEGRVRRRRSTYVQL